MAHQEYRPKIVDAHAHVWLPAPPGTAPLTTVVGGEADISVELLRACLAEHGVERAVLVQPVYPGEDNSYVASAAAREPEKFAAVCVVDPRQPDASDRLAYWAGRGCRGLRLRPRIPDEAKSFGAPTTFALWETAQRLGTIVSVMCDFDHLAALASLAERYPDTAIVIDHLAHPRLPMTEAQMVPLLNLSRFPRAHVKLSGLYYFSRQEYPHLDCVDVVRAAYDRFGPQRLLWGSDFPHVTKKGGYGQALSIVGELLSGLNAEEQRMILGENARGLYWS